METEHSPNRRHSSTVRWILFNSDQQCACDNVQCNCTTWILFLHLIQSLNRLHVYLLFIRYLRLELLHEERNHLFKVQSGFAVVSLQYVKKQFNQYELPSA